MGLCPDCQVTSCARLGIETTLCHSPLPHSCPLKCSATLQQPVVAFQAIRLDHEGGGTRLVFACGSDDERQAEWCLCCDGYIPRRCSLRLPECRTHCVLSATSGCFRGLTAGNVGVLVPVFPLIFAHIQGYRKRWTGFETAIT